MIARIRNCGKSSSGYPDYARLAPAATAPRLAALFGTGPFTRLEEFDTGVVRERSPVRDAIEL